MMPLPMRGFGKLYLCAALAWASLPVFAQAPSSADEVLRSLRAVRGYNAVAISPDGTQIAWVENHRAGVHEGRGTTIYVAPVNAAERARRISAAPGESAYEDEPAWSSDSKQLAFLSDGGKLGQQQQLYVAEAGSGKTRKLTSLTGYLTAPQWSPDGKSVALLFTQNSPRAAGPLQPMTPPSGLIEEQIYEQRIDVIDAETGVTRAVSPADLYVYEYDWLPDGSGWVGSAAPGNGDNNWWIAQLYWFGADGHARSLYKPKLQIASPRVAPDGRNVAFIEGLMSDLGVTGGDVFTIPLTVGGEGIQNANKDTTNYGNNAKERNLTPRIPASATWLRWTDARKLLFTEIIDGKTGVAAVDTDGNLSQIWSGPEMISAGDGDVNLSLARDGKQSAVVRSSAQHAPEIWVGALGAWKQFTHANGEAKIEWGEQRSIHWRRDDFKIQGWLLFPRHYISGRKYPLIVHVHGGPAAACTAEWPSEIAHLAAAGYFVLCPNPRGSFGQGEAFTEANVKDFGGGDFRDIMAGVDEVARQFPIAADRVGIEGWSYGGYMTMWAETQTTRFRAAFAGAGLSDWLSYYGENDIDQWMIPYFGASVYDDPAVYARSAPINFVKNVQTPTLIVVGDRDGECPAPQSFEWWHALAAFHVPVEFVVYPDEGHMIQLPEHRRDIILRSLQWYAKYLSP